VKAYGVTANTRAISGRTLTKSKISKFLQQFGRFNRRLVARPPSIGVKIVTDLQEGAMAIIENVTISEHGMVIANAPSGEIAPPPAAPLTINNASWKVGSKEVLKYLEKTCQVSATAANTAWKGNYKITSISGDDKTIKMEPAS
jgi:hypothetical protein